MGKNKIRKKETQKTQPEAQNKIKQENRRKIDKQEASNVLSVILFTIFSILLLGISYDNYMHKIEALSLFIGTSSFFDNCMVVPGGLLNWLGALFTQSFYHPWLGAFTYTLLLIIILLTSYKAFNLPKRLMPIAVILPSLILLSFVSLGYAIFSLKPIGYSFSLPLGIIFALLIYWCYRKISNIILQSILIIIVAAIGYPYLGFYALLATAMCAASNLLKIKSKSKLTQIIPFIIGVLSIFLVPKIRFAYVDSEVIYSQMYISGLPRLYSVETELWLLYILTFTIMLVGAVLSPIFNKLRNNVNVRSSAIGRLWPSIVYIISIVTVFVARYDDKNFMTTLDLDRAIWDQNWQEAITIAENQNDTPTRINTLLGYVALLRNGQTGDKLLDIKYGWEPYNTKRQARAMLDASGALISYHLGLINYANRWSTEYMVEQGMSVERLKMLAKCALLNYELPLAKHYIDILYNTINHRDWAKKYLHYVNNPMDMAGDQELAMIHQLMCYPNEFINDKGTFEGYIWPLIISCEGRSPLFDAMSIDAALISRDLNAAMAKIQNYYVKYHRLPKYYQEAAILWSKLNNCPLPFDVEPTLWALHDNFNTSFHQTVSIGAEGQRDRLYDTYRNTYWYYFIFTDDKPIM